MNLEYACQIFEIFVLVFKYDIQIWIYIFLEYMLIYFSSGQLACVR